MSGKSTSVRRGAVQRFGVQRQAGAAFFTGLCGLFRVMNLVARGHGRFVRQAARGAKGSQPAVAEGDAPSGQHRTAQMVHAKARKAEAG